MAGYQPPYTITPAILNQVVEVGELLIPGNARRIHDSGGRCG